MIDIYVLGIIINSSALLSTTSNFLAAFLGTDLIIYKRFVTNAQEIKTVIFDV